MFNVHTLNCVGKGPDLTLRIEFYFLQNGDMYTNYIKSKKVLSLKTTRDISLLTKIDKFSTCNVGPV